MPMRAWARATVLRAGRQACQRRSRHGTGRRCGFWWLRRGGVAPHPAASPGDRFLCGRHGSPRSTHHCPCRRGPHFALAVYVPVVRHPSPVYCTGGATPDHWRPSAQNCDGANGRSSTLVKTCPQSFEPNRSLPGAVMPQVRGCRRPSPACRACSVRATPSQLTSVKLSRAPATVARAGSSVCRFRKARRLRKDAPPLASEMDASPGAGLKYVLPSAHQQGGRRARRGAGGELG